MVREYVAGQQGIVRVEEREDLHALVAQPALPDAGLCEVRGVHRRPRSETKRGEGARGSRSRLPIRVEDEIDVAVSRAWPCNTVATPPPTT